MFIQKKDKGQIFIFESTITPKSGNLVKSLYSDQVMTIVSISPENELNPFDRVVTCKWLENGLKKEADFKMTELRDVSKS